jgi:metallo-beta-lactamase family protein
VPKLCRAGYRGPILCTRGTADLLEWLLPDAGAIQEAEVERLNRRNAQRDRPPVAPIYTRADAEACLTRIQPQPLEEWVRCGAGVRARFWPAGHILGSSSIELEIEDAGGQMPLRLLFSGDVGPTQSTLQSAARAGSNYDYLIVEATYGDRDRPSPTPETRRRALLTEIEAARAAGGNLLIPAFAVERTQELLFDLARLIAEHQLPASTQVFIDSPLAARATTVFGRHWSELAPGTPAPFDAPQFRYVMTAEESGNLSRIRGGAVILAGSGMCEAGRIRGHLQNHLWRADATVLFVGYQAPGTLGALLRDGAEAVRIHGQEVSVRCRIRKLDGYSGHADRSMLLDWVSARMPIRRGIFLTHGEPPALSALAAGLAGIGVDPRLVRTPELDESVRLDLGAEQVTKPAAPRLGEDAKLAVLKGRDWHNDYAELALDLQHRLLQAPGERERAKLLRRLRRALDEEP